MAVCIVRGCVWWGEFGGNDLIRAVMIVGLATLAVAVDHAPLDALLKRHVHGNRVDYNSLAQERSAIVAYVDSLAKVNTDKLSRDERMAMFINAYNACTLNLVVENLSGGLKSLKDIPENRRWKDERWNVGGHVYTLNDIEHKVLRAEFKDPRVHASINCASVGCPPLRAEAFTADRLDAQLDEQFRRFVNDRNQIHVKDGVLYLSSIFDWFRGDFETEERTVLGWIKRYANEDLRRSIDQLGSKPVIKYIDWDWSLCIVAERN